MPNYSPVIIEQDKHKISKKQLTKNVISVIEKLKKAGFQAYIVGGGVRDLLLSYKPKDFDIATDAKPEQVRAIFKNSRIIGRRFRLIHVYFGREIIEVATFRASPKSDDNDDHVMLDGRIVRDNIYGTIDDDIWRRDFTVNSMYYDPIDGQIIDYCNGFEDLQNHTLKLLGDPKTRYREDPVRILRALRFSAKLDFNIEEKTLAPIKDKEFHDLLDNVPKARLFEEYNKMFLGGHAEKCFYILKEHELFYKLFPFTATQQIEDHYPQHLSFVHAVLKSTDTRIENDLPINPAFLIAAFLWHALHLEHKKMTKGKTNKEYTWRQAAHSIIKKQNAFLTIPKRVALVMEDIWFLQRLFNRTHKNAIVKAAEHSKFRAGFDFLVIRSELEPVNEQLLSWWQQYEAASDKVRAKLLDKYGE